MRHAIRQRTRHSIPQFAVKSFPTEPSQIASSTPAKRGNYSAKTPVTHARIQRPGRRKALGRNNIESRARRLRLHEIQRLKLDPTTAPAID